MGLNGVNSYYTGYEAVSGKKTAAKDIDNTTASKNTDVAATYEACLLYTSPSPRDCS